MNKNKEFVKNTIILFIGKFATQFMSLLLLPLYTHYLLTDDYGTVDLLQTYISLFIPILTLRIDSALFRFLIDKRNNDDEIKSILSNTIFILLMCIILTLLISCLFGIIVTIKYYILVIINIIIMMTSSILLQALRGLGKNKDYSVASIITGITTLLFNILFIIGLKYNASSILISSSIANLICAIYVMFNIKLFKYLSVKKVNKKIIIDILKYSFPMIPNSLSWWIVNVSDRTLISFFLGVSLNAIYTVSCKFSNILNSVFSIISMSWQESASLHINDKDRDKFFTDMINNIFMIFSTISLLMVSILPLIYDILIGENYITSYKYIPILLYANLWNVLIGLIGGIYIAKKETKKIASTTIASAVINIVINLVLIKFIGLYAACFSTLMSYMLMSIYRYIDCQKYVKLKIDFKKFICFTLIYCISSWVYLYGKFSLIICNLIIATIYGIFINKNVIISGIKTLKNKLIK